MVENWSVTAEILLTFSCQTQLLSWVVVELGLWKLCGVGTRILKIRCIETELGLPWLIFSSAMSRVFLFSYRDFLIPVFYIVLFGHFHCSTTVAWFHRESLEVEACINVGKISGVGTSRGVADDQCSGVNWQQCCKWTATNKWLPNTFFVWDSSLMNFWQNTNPFFGVLALCAMKIYNFRRCFQKWRWTQTTIISIVSTPIKVVVVVVVIVVVVVFRSKTFLIRKQSMSKKF